MSNWIDVRDELPEPGISVLIWVKKGRTPTKEQRVVASMIRTEGNGPYWFDIHKQCIVCSFESLASGECEITHWAHLPERPEDGTERHIWISDVNHTWLKKIGDGNIRLGLNKLLAAKNEFENKH